MITENVEPQQQQTGFFEANGRRERRASLIPYHFSQPKTLASETRSKNDRIPIGLIGAGGMGIGNMQAAREWVDVVAIADVDKGSPRIRQPDAERWQSRNVQRLS